MSELNTDWRIIRTKRVIKIAFSELIEEKGFEGVKIKDLLTKANITRGTFYSHYDDKFDLLEQCQDEVLLKTQEITKDIQITDLINFDLKKEPLPFLVNLYDYFKKNAPFMRAILGPKGDTAFQKKLTDLIEFNFLEKITMEMSKAEQLLVTKDVYLAFMRSAHLGVIQHWLNTGMKQSPREIALIISAVTLMGPISFEPAIT
jgi:AcrR family transcriptional regulator